MSLLPTMSDHIIHCNKKTEVLDTRHNIRVRRCTICGQRFKTQEILIPFGNPGVPSIPCPISSQELQTMLDNDYQKEVAKKLFVSVKVLKRWIKEYNL